MRFGIQKITVQHMLYVFRFKNNHTIHVAFLLWDLIFQKITTLHMCVRIHFILCMVIFSLYSSKENISFWE